MGKWTTADKRTTYSAFVKSNQRSNENFGYNILLTHLQRTNAEVDKLSKENLLLPPRLMEVTEYAENILVNQYVRL